VRIWISLSRWCTRELMLTELCGEGFGDANTLGFLWSTKSNTPGYMLTFVYGCE